MTPGETPRMAGWLESAWLARYLDRQLEGEELAWFEAYLLDKPELMGMVEVDNGLRDALAKDPVRPSNPAVSDVSVSKRASRGIPAGFAVAASLALGLGIGWLAKPGNPLEGQGVIADPTRVVFDTMRGEATEPHLEHGDSASPFVLVEIAVPAEAQDVVVRLSGRMDRALEVSRDGFVSFLVPRASIASNGIARLSYREAGVQVSRTIDLAAMRRVP